MPALLSHLVRPVSLLVRTSATLAVSALAIALVSVAALDAFVIDPIAEQSADDEAALLVLSAQTWVELPPRARPYFELELFESHDLVISPEVRDLEPLQVDLPYMDLLHESLDARLQEDVRLLRGTDSDLIWAEIPMGGYRLQIGFSPDRRDIEPLFVALVILVAGAGIVLAASLLTVQRITRPLDAVARSAATFRGGQSFEPLPETGPTELVTLIRSFNTMAHEISELIANRTTLLAGISHDLRTPLARMRLAVELLPADIDPDLVDRLRRNLEEMDELLAITLQFARGLSHVHSERIELRGWLEAFLATHGTGSLDWRGPPRLELELDAPALRRVLVNLIENAEQYGGDDVKLRVAMDGRGVDLHVLDRGRGIPEEMRAQVFQPFFRLDASRAAGTGGSGLGLAVVKQLCEAQGWTVDVGTRAGGGADFRIHIPLSS